MMRAAWPWWRYVLTALSALATGLSGYLAWHQVTGGSVAGCGGGSPCDAVLNSRWSMLGGILPVSGLGVGVYSAILMASISIGPATDPSIRRLAWRAMLVLAGAAVGGAVWFAAIQKWVIGAFCPYCMATHLSGVALAGLIVWRAGQQAEDHPPVGAGRPLLTLSLAAASVAGVLAIAPLVFKKESASLSGEARRSSELDLKSAPTIGNPNARYVVSVLFDYKCPHCQRLHFLLNETVRQYDGSLAFALCPAPLSTKCNPYVTRDVAAFKDSCDLVRIALAVWVADPAVFRVFDHWMFSLETGDRWQPRSVAAAKAKAIELVGPARFDAARTNAWIDRYLQDCVRLYGSTGDGAVPKLVLGSHWVTPEPDDAAELVQILQSSLKVARP